MDTHRCPVGEQHRGWSIDTAQWNYLLVQMGRIRWQDWMKMHYLQNFSLQINQGTLTWQSVFMTYLGNQCMGHFGIFLVLRPIMLKSWHVSKPKIWRILEVTSHWLFSLLKMHLTCFLEKTFPNLFQGSQFLNFTNNNSETLARKPTFWFFPRKNVEMKSHTHIKGLKSKLSGTQAESS